MIDTVCLVQWKVIIEHLIAHDNLLFTDLLTRVTVAAGGLFSSNEVLPLPSLWLWFQGLSNRLEFFFFFFKKKYIYIYVYFIYTPVPTFPITNSVNRQQM